MATGRITVAKKLDFETATDRDGDTDRNTVRVHGHGVRPFGLCSRTKHRLCSPLVSADGALTVYVTVTDQNDAPGEPTVGVVTTKDRTPLAHAVDTDMPSYVVR